MEVPNDAKLPDMWHLAKLRMTEVWDLIPWDLNILENIVSIRI